MVRAGGGATRRVCLHACGGLLWALAPFAHSRPRLHSLSPCSVYKDGKVCISILHEAKADEFNTQEKMSEKCQWMARWLSPLAAALLAFDRCPAADSLVACVCSFDSRASHSWT